MNVKVRLVCGLLLIALLLWAEVAQACTIFVLTDGRRALFFNNEDYSNPRTRVWFVPGGTNYLGAAYFGFDDGTPQGGLNTAGLAYDWVAGFKSSYKPSSHLKPARGFSCARLLESCSTLEQAIEFYRAHREPSFAAARIMIADKSGASAIIGARDGKIFVDRQQSCRGFGYGHSVLEKTLANPPPPTAANGAEILRAAMQEGEFATKYSNVFDLTTGDISIYLFKQSEEPIQLNLATELKKGGHYYDLPEIRRQLGAAPQPLLSVMKRLPLDEFSAVADERPEITRRLTRVVREAATGKMKSDDYTAELWKVLSPQQVQIQKDLGKFGKLRSLTLVNKLPEDPAGTRRYKMDFDKASVLQTFVVNSGGLMANSASEAVEFRF